MTVTINGTTGITTPAVTNEGAYTGDGVVFADATPSNTLVTTTGGNVGIGTSSPSVNLAVVSSSTLTRLHVQNSTSGTTSTDGVQLSISGSDGYLWNFENGFTAFGTNNTERMRIDSSGNLLVGTTTANGKVAIVSNSVTGQYPLYLNDSSTSGNNIIVDINHNGTRVGSIATTTTATSYNTSSDYRLKENIEPMTGSLAKVSALKPVTYTWKADGSSGQGFIAHELAEVVPDAVYGEKDAVDDDGKPVYQGIDTSFLVATLTAAIQELKAEFDEYKATHP